MADQTNNVDELAELNRINKAAKKIGLDVVRLDETSIQPEALKLVAEKLAREYRLMPVKLEGNTLLVALANPSLLSKPAPAFMQDLKKKQGYQLKLMLTPGVDLDKALTAYSPKKEHPDQKASAKAPQMAAATPPSPSPSPAPKKMTRPPVKVPASVNSRDVQEVDLSNIKIDQAALERFPEDVARKYQMVVFKLSNDGKEASIAAAKPNDPKVREILKFVEEKNQIKIALFKASKESLAIALAQYQAPAPKKETQAPTEVSKKNVPTNNLPPKIKAVTETPTTPAAPSPAPISTPKPQETQVTGAPPVSPPKVEAPTIAVSELQSQAGLAGTQTKSAETGQITAEEVEEQDLDAILGTTVTDLETFETMIKSGLIPKIVAAAVSYAANLDASDIHIEGGEENVRIRYRIDGKLQDIVRVPLELQAPLVSRIKILARLKIDETRLPQDGRFDVKVNKRQFDLRISTLPTVKGEKVVMRLLDKSGGAKKLEDLGLTGTGLHRVIEALKDPYGITLVTGPTGSGKSTSLYAMLTILNREDVNIITLEDPVEYQLDGVSQVQVKPKIGLTFANGLRSVLRQDPDIVMVGEIRDSETAALATQAALTGHLVLSTLHTNTAAGAIPRLEDMKVEPFLIASSVNIVVAQRLIRKLCQKCKVPAEVPIEALDEYRKTLAASVVPAVKQAAEGEMKFFSAKGCDECSGGYKGRFGIYEVLEMSDAIAELAIKKSSSDEIDAQARKEGIVTLQQDGLLKALAGITSLDEVLQATVE